MAFSSLAMIWGEDLPALFIFLSGDQLARTNFTSSSPSSSSILLFCFVAGISPQWLSELRRLWPVFPDELDVSLFSLIAIGSHTVPGQHSQPT